MNETMCAQKYQISFPFLKTSFQMSYLQNWIPEKSKAY